MFLLSKGGREIETDTHICGTQRHTDRQTDVLEN